MQRFYDKEDSYTEVSEEDLYYCAWCGNPLNTPDSQPQKTGLLMGWCFFCDHTCYKGNLIRFDELSEVQQEMWKKEVAEPNADDRGGWNT